MSLSVADHNKIVNLLKTKVDFKCYTTPKQHASIQRLCFKHEVWWHQGQKYVLTAKDDINENYIIINHGNSCSSITSHNFHDIKYAYITQDMQETILIPEWTQAMTDNVVKELANANIK